MRAGNLRHEITIQHSVTTKDEYGGDVTTWETFAERHADVLPVKGREFIAAAAAQAETTVRFVMRYMEGIDTTMRVSFRGEPYDIQAVLNDGTRDRTLTLITQMGVNDG